MEFNRFRLYNFHYSSNRSFLDLDHESPELQYDAAPHVTQTPSNRKGYIPQGTGN